VADGFLDEPEAAMTGVYLSNPEDEPNVREQQGYRIPIDIGSVDYDRYASEQLLAEMIRQRDAAVAAGNPDQALKLAHVVGWMRFVLKELWPEESPRPEPRPSPEPRLPPVDDTALAWPPAGGIEP
jgi:hypothetical protein